MPVLLEVLGFVLFGAATFLFLNARETAQENRRLLKQTKAQSEQLRAIELRLRRVEVALCERPQATEDVELGEGKATL